jgi:hypothetical protein
MKTIKIISFLALLLFSNTLFAQIKATEGDFVGCWETQWTSCNAQSGGKTKLSIKKDLNQASQYTGAWAGGPTDKDGFLHCGFLMGKINGDTFYGTWYEIIYKTNIICPGFSYSGTFQFKLSDKNNFEGTWKDTDGVNKDCKTIMKWWGKRSL